MSEIKLEAGQWYRTRGGEIVYCVWGKPAWSNYPFAVGTSKGDIYATTPYGLFYSDGPVHRSDIIEHLPDCTGFDWVPPKPKYRAFANLKEFLPHRDRFVCTNVPGDKYPELYRVNVFNHHTFWLHSERGVTYARGLEEYRFADVDANGELVFSPFGVLDQ